MAIKIEREMQAEPPIRRATFTISPYDAGIEFERRNGLFSITVTPDCDEGTEAWLEADELRELAGLLNTLADDLERDQ